MALKMFILLLSFVLLRCPQVQGHQCKVTPNLHPTGSKIDCRDLNLKSVPSDLPQDTVWLDMTDNLLTTLPDFTFDSLLLLERLDLTSNRISKLEENAFSGLSSLEYLSLEHNQLNLDNDSYPRNIFLPLRNLTFLSICANDNNVDGQIPDYIFRNTPKLETLFIDSFSDTRFGRGFRALVNLKSLNLKGHKWRDEDTYCSLKHLFNDTFDVFENSSIELLDLSHCMLSHIEADAFLPLRNVSTIILTDSNSIPIQNAIRSLNGVKRRGVKKLMFNKLYKYINSDVDKQVLKANSVPYFNNLCIENVDLSENNLLYIGPEIVLMLGPCLKYLDISQNILMGSIMSLLAVSNCQYLEYFDFSRQQRYSQQSDRNHLSLRSMRFPLPPKLEYLDFSESAVKIGKLGDIEFSNGFSLKVMNMARNGLRNLTYEVKGIKNITFLDISGNDGYGITGQFISSFPQIKHLFMNDVKLENKVLLRGAGLYAGLRSLIHVEELSMESNNIQYIDDNIFEQMTELSVISLSNNNIETVNFNLRTLTKLTHLDLAMNSLTYLNLETIAILDSFVQKRNFSLSLHRNPLYCSCETLFFIEWLYTTKVQLDSGGNYDCVTDNGVMTTTGEVHRRILYHWRRCQGRVWFSAALILLCVLLLMIMTWVALTRNWTRILHRLLVLLGRGAEQLERQDFGKDAYVAHCEEDRQEVADNLRHRLEHYGLRLVLPYRDFLPGRFIAENIVESVYESWKTVLVVTADFLLDPMSYFIMRTVSHSVSIHHQNRVILLLIGEVDRGRLPDSFVNIIDEDNVLELDVFPAVNSNVWVEVRDMILA